MSDQQAGALIGLFMACLFVGTIVVLSRWEHRRRARLEQKARVAEQVYEQWWRNTEVCPTCAGDGRVRRQVMVSQL